MVFTTEGASFAPVLVVEGDPGILWTWSDGTTSTAAAPTRTFGSASTRSHSLRVTPWSAVRRINIGYDGGDGGSGLIESVPDQHVAAVSGLNLVAPTLGQWCSSYNRPLRSSFPVAECLSSDATGAAPPGIRPRRRRRAAVGAAAS